MSNDNNTNDDSSDNNLDNDNNSSEKDSSDNNLDNDSSEDNLDNDNNSSEKDSSGNNLDNDSSEDNLDNDSLDNNCYDNDNTDLLTISSNTDNTIEITEEITETLTNSLNSNISEEDSSSLDNSYISENIEFTDYYSENEEDNKNITLENFINLINSNIEIKNLIDESKKNINNITKLLYCIKKKDVKLANNIMTNPVYYFKQMFDKFNKNYLDKYNDKINEIQSILPNIDKLAIYEALTVCDFNIENSINYLYEYNITIV
jgi:hypothetical protein